MMFRQLFQKSKFNLHQFTKRTAGRVIILENDPPFIEKKLFIENGDELINKLQSAFEIQKQYEELPKLNQNMMMNKNIINQQLKLIIQGFIFDYNHKLLFYQSPLNGGYKYFIQEHSMHWINNKDDHLFLDNLVREITKYCKGYLEL